MLSGRVPQPLNNVLSPSSPHHAPSGETPPSADQRVTAVLRRRTHALHVQAERSGIVREILRRRASRFGYALYLRNLLPAYEALEDGLEQESKGAHPSGLALPELYRRDALRADLIGLYGSDWAASLPLLPEAEAYANGVAESAGAGHLPAHAYVRYLGDLNGGQTLRDLLAASLGLGPDSLTFYSFPAISDLSSFKLRYRQLLDEAVIGAAEIDATALEAERAFSFNISISEAVLAAAADAPEPLSARAPAVP